MGSFHISEKVINKEGIIFNFSWSFIHFSQSKIVFISTYYNVTIESIHCDAKNENSDYDTIV